ncbi:MAG: glycosyltransferase family 4 protein [Planctomycetota bacterium]|jgi:glycosyltransferase involved in cell wall biosynthesis
MTRNKVVILTPCLLVGGTEVHTLMLARSLAEGGYRVTVCAYYEHDPAMVRAVEAAGAEVVLLNLRRTPGRNLGSMPKLARDLGSVIRSCRPDYVHVQYMTPAVAPVVVARALGVPRVLATVHVTAEVYGRRAWIPSKIMTRLTDAFLCVSRSAERSFFNDASLLDEETLRRGRKHFTIHNPVDLDRVDFIDRHTDRRQAAAWLGLGEGPVVGMVARMSHEKGADDLVEAFATLTQTRPDAQLVMVGDGQLRSDLERRVGRHGLTDRVRWVGRVEPEKALACMAMMDVVVVPSRSEGFGLVAAEAMALRKPVVASDVGGLSEVVEHGVTGALVPPCQPVRLADAVTDLLHDPNRRAAMGRAGRKRVENLFSRKVFAERHQRLYRALAGAGARRPGQTPDTLTAVAPDSGGGCL